MPLIAHSPYDPVLTGIGVLTNGNISKDAEKAFVDDVILLLALGNPSGKTLKPIADLFPYPPIPGPKILNQDFFWFGPDPVSAIQASIFLDESQLFNQIFIQTLYKSTATLFDQGGNTPFFPIFDVSAPFGIELPIPFTLPDLATKAHLNPLTLPAKLVSMGLKLSLPTIPVPKIPNIVPTAFTFPNATPTSLGLPHVTIGVPAPPVFTLPSFVTGLVKLPVDLLTSLLLPPKLELVTDLPNLPKLVGDVAINLLFTFLQSVGLVSPNALPKTLIAALLVYMKNVIAIVCVVIVSQLVGTGSLALGIGELLGLVKN